MTITSWRLPVALSLAAVLFCALGTSTLAEEVRRSVVITKPTSTSDPSYSGDRQYEVVGKRLSKPLRVQVVDGEGRPVANWPVRFSQILSPAGAEVASVDRNVVHTNSTGYAETAVTLGSKPGEYAFSAVVQGAAAGDEVAVFSAFARKSNWIFLLVIGLLGGLGIFLYGMAIMSDGMKKSAGEGMRTILGTVTNNRFVAVAVGAFVTMVIQSSSATTVMLVSFVQAQLVTFSQSLGIILGADIGTTITAQLIAFRLTDYALLMVAVGIILMLLTKNEKIKDIGETILGFGLLFFGMHVMSESMHPLRTHPAFIGLLVNLENPIVGILVGMAFTALIQSSAAVIGILIVLASQGALTLEAAIPVLLGANIGTCVTAALATIDTGREAKRVALAHTSFKVIGVLLFVWWIPSFADLVRGVSPKGAPELTGTAHLADVLPRQIANAHTIFNVALTLLLLPWTQIAARFFTWFLPDKKGDREAPFKTEYLDNALISTPALALNLAKAEVLRMAGIVGSMVEQIIVPFTEGNRDVLAVIDRSEEEVDFLDQKTSHYLTKISRQGVHEERVDEVFQMMYAVTELEQIADIVAKTLRPRAEAWLAGNYEFSEEGREELRDFHLRTLKQLSRAISVFDDLNLEKAKNLKKKHKKYRAMEEQFRRAHFERLRRDIPETVATTEFHQELMEQFRRINGHATNIGRIVLAWSEHVEDAKGHSKPD